MTELRQIAVARAMSLLGDIDDAEDEAGEVLIKFAMVRDPYLLITGQQVLKGKCVYYMGIIC